MSITTYLSDALLGHQIGKAAYTMPTVYVALSSTTPVIAGTGATEPSTGSYARVATSAASWNTPAAEAVSNATAITFPTATADWSSGASLTYAVLYDASTGGNMLSFAPLAVAKACLNGDTVSIAAGAFTISLS